MQAILLAVCIFDFLADFLCRLILMLQIATAVLFLCPGKEFPAENDSFMSAVAEGGLSWMGRFAKWGLVGIAVKKWCSAPPESWE